MSEPVSMSEYLKRFHSVQKFSGGGITGTKCHMPCPFCAAPDWAVYLVLETETALQQEHICKECARGAKTIIQKTATSAILTLVQTSGPDAPAWLDPKPERA